MPIRTRLDKAQGNNVVFLAVRPLPFRLGDQIAAVNEWPCALALRSFHSNLRRKPLRKAVNGDSTRRRVGVLTISGRLIDWEARSFQVQPKLAQETGFHDLPLAVVTSPVPRVQAADNRGMVGQVHEGAGTEHVDDPAAANLSVGARHYS